MNNIENELNRLNFEDWILIIIITLTVFNIFGNNLQKEYIKTNNTFYINESNTIFTITLIISIFVYLYFVQRNYNLYKNSKKENKKLNKIKLLGSILLLVGSILLLYFQINNTKFIGTPAT